LESTSIKARGSNYQTQTKGIHVAEDIKSRSKDKVFEVYWVHLPVHTDIKSQGYVGITCQGALVRFYKHKSEAINLGKDWVFHRAIRKYGHKNLIVETILVCDYDYARGMEESLRPERYTGWNTCEGGGVGFLEPLENLHGTPEFSKMRSDYMLSAWQDEDYKNKMMASKKIYFEETPPWRRAGNAVNHTAWKLAGICYILHTKLGWGRAKAANYLLFSEGSISRVFDHIVDGWNPTEDGDYLDMYDVPSLMSIEDIYGDTSQYHMSWKRKDASGVWGIADDLYYLYTKDVPLKDIAKYANVTWHQTHKIYKRFAGGWNPNLDLRWRADFKGYVHEH